MERESTALINEFDAVNDLVKDEVETVVDAFLLPARNWNQLIDSYNLANKRKFPLTALECKVILEYVKKGQPAKAVFKAVGVSHQKFTWWQNQHSKLEERLDVLRTKGELSDEETTEFYAIMHHPLRILLTDIERAEGIADLVMWERFNEMAEAATDMKAMQMKARFKEIFSERQQEAGGFNVQINLGGSWIEEL